MLRINFNTKNEQFRGGNLTDYVLVRQNELSRVLAGCSIVDPGFVLELVGKLKPADLTDERARKFLQELDPDSDPIETARATGTINEYPRWLGLACDELPNLRQTAREAVDEIRRLTIMREAIAELSTWLTVAQSVGRCA